MDKQKMKEMKHKILFTDYIVKPPKKNYSTYLREFYDLTKYRTVLLVVLVPVHVDVVTGRARRGGCLPRTSRPQ